jgi:hypothetical protein
MEIDEIQTFLTIAELGGFTPAAQRLHRSQPAISRRLGILAQELGVPLFMRLRGWARLTRRAGPFCPMPKRRCIEALRRFAAQSKNIWLELRTASSRVRVGERANEGSASAHP